MCKIEDTFFVQLDNPKFTLIIAKTGCQVTNMIP